MQLSKKLKTFCQFFIAFVKSILNFLKNERDSLSISEIICSERQGCLKIKGSVSENPSGENVLLSPKKC